ncbi:hypothetical protein Y1Q_0024252 [Alligator mississippiensis]|uniref:Reverse transcriptase domain-containing protein n=1 Tax=Alligator mississippiensis TaxID=8496 RepID=A0A151NIA7_ALLMI|nr:hypothetical protein Y1Q_0024252 [Alligator mississippiensis]
MRKLGIIEDSQSPWRSPMMVIPKPNGSIRLCIDYRKVNEIATFDAFPMPQVDDMLERVGQAWLRKSKEEATMCLTGGKGVEQWPKGSMLATVAAFYQELYAEKPVDLEVMQLCLQSLTWIIRENEQWQLEEN